MNDYSELRKKYREEMKPCEVCGSDDLAPFQEFGRVAEAGVYGDVKITICKCCGYKMQNPRFEDQFYEDYYQEMYRAVAFGTTKPSDEYIAQQKERGAGVLAWTSAHNINPGRMLDHGCASGATMLGWKDDGWDVAGIDPHRPSVETGRLMGLEIEIAAGENLPFKENSFDLLLSLGSFEHSYDLEKTMREANRVIVEDGHMVIRWRTNVIFGSPIEYYNHNHYRFFSPNSWKICLERYGFSIIDTTDDKLEGWASYSYILAKKDHAIDPARIEILLSQGVKDHFEEELDHLQSLRDGYYKRCKTFLDFLKENPNKSAQNIIDEMRKGVAGIKWDFLGGNPETVVERAKMEALRFVPVYEEGKVC